MIAPLAAFGCAKVKVSKKPRAAILVTGSEIVGIDEKPVCQNASCVSPILINLY